MTTGTETRYDFATIRRANRLADVVQSYGVRLRPSGRALVGLCPLHGDQTKPNLHVYVDPTGARDNWFCFRCMHGGDVVNFVMRREALGLAEACQRLGGHLAPAGPTPQRPEDPPRWDRLDLTEQVVMNTALAVYQHALWREPGALAYLQARGLPSWTIRECGLGYADGQTLERFLRRSSSLRVAERLGLLRRPAGGDDSRPQRELLAGRIVVPEIRGGHCVWLIGRTVGDPGDRPKYLGLPGERPVLGWERVVGRREAFAVEGVFGYLTGVAWRLPVCGLGGTHLPSDRLGFLARADRVWGLLDPDDAGRAAAERFGDALGPRWSPLWLPDGAEIDDLAARPGGRAAFLRCLAAARAADTHAKESVHAR